MLCVYYKHIYAIICNNIRNYTMLYNKKKKNEIYIFIFYYRAWVPNLFETMSHCPIYDSEMSQ